MHLYHTYHPAPQGGSSSYSTSDDSQSWAADDGQIWAQQGAGPIPAWGIPPVPCIPTLYYPAMTYSSHMTQTTPILPASLPTLASSPPNIPPAQMDGMVPSTPIIEPSILDQLPHDFPPHADSIRAELFPLLINPGSDVSDPLTLLGALRATTYIAHQGSVYDMPTIFSYARVSYFHPSGSPLNPNTPRPAGSSLSSPNNDIKTITRFGVSAPRIDHIHSFVAKQVRDYRIRKCWGTMNPPHQSQEQWRHGQCAESQSLPAVVAWCEYLQLENVLIESLAMHKGGKELSGMCKNCLSYVALVLWKHPSWRVVDVHTGNVFRIN